MTQYKSFEASSQFVSANVLLVGQIYTDIILTVDHFPEEDSKLRATETHQRRGGNCLNTAEVLCQSPRINTFIMSALGPKEDSAVLLSQLKAKSINTLTCMFRKEPTPSSYIIQSNETGSRTIISANSIQDIKVDEFISKMETVLKETRLSWIHFEGRNVQEAVKQIDWIDSKATREGWRSRLTVSVELEKPDRPYIDSMLSRGDVVFFSKLYAEKRGYKDPSKFLQDYHKKCRKEAILFCTWGAIGATCLYEQKILHSPAPRIKPVDNIGAGDTFTAGVIFAVSQGNTIQFALKFACNLASKKVAQYGFEGLGKDL